MKRERASAVCVHAGKLLTVLLRDPVTHTARLFVPGGAIEAGESAEEAAIRETLEETGYHVARQPRPIVIAHYPFTWAGQEFEVTTHFAAVHLVDATATAEPVDDAAYLEGVHWIALGDVPQQLGFDLNILSAVLQLVDG
ncbi:MAG TPA: NUDIX domain-containing protein [Polyangiales bacterium]|nr:NUDIX domain-containing protein [Polyangiales bacterium]